MSIWFDNWLHLGPIYTVMGDTALFETGLSRYATVSTLIRNGRWRWPWTSSPDQLVLKQVVDSLPPPDIRAHDQIHWDPSNSGKFSINSPWECIRTRKESVDWDKLIWFAGRIPKTAFCLWLAIRSRLGTQDRLHYAGSNLNCLLCNSQPEDHDHLFFTCSVSSQV